MSEIDPDLGAAWRAASREQPPAALDDSIRAAARREVGAKPGRMRAAPRWWPLAAAATVAAVAVGIVQMTPPEQVTPAAFPPATNAARQEANSPALKPADTAQKRDAVAAPPAEAQGGALREEVGPIAKEQKRRAADETNAAAGSVGRFAAPPGAPTQDKKTALQAPAQPAKETTERDQAAKQKAELAAALTVEHPKANAVSPPAAPSPPRNEVQPFPASPAPADAGASNAPPPMMAPAPAPPPPSAPAAAPAPASTSAPATTSRKLAAQSSPSPPAAMAESAINKDFEAGRTPAALGKVASADAGKVASADADKATPERRKDAAPLAPDEWIKRIRRLIAEGRNDDAAKELAAFRREYKERAESLLPIDLRTFRP